MESRFRIIDENGNSALTNFAGSLSQWKGPGVWHTKVARPVSVLWQSMRTMNAMRNKYAQSFALAAIGATFGIALLAQSTNLASNASPTNAMSGYAEAARKALVSGTEATNLTEVEVGHLLNESIKTNLAAQLWYRRAMMGTASAQGAEISQTLRVLETLRAGRTEEAIRLLEDDLDNDIIGLAFHLRMGDESKTFTSTPGPRKSLQWARDYRVKFPYKSGNAAADDQAKNALSYLDQK